MSEIKAPKGLPAKCINRKTPYMPATRWWCGFCKYTGGRICSPVCKVIGEKKN